MRRAIPFILLGTLVLTGCGGDASDDLAAPPAAAPSPSAAAAEPVVVDVAENDGKDARDAVLSVGQLVHVDLATCGGCGYEWRVDTPPDTTVAAAEHAAQPAPSAASGPPLPGTPTTTRLAFRGLKAGSSTVSIGYHGPASTKPDRIVVLTLTVT